MHVNYRRPDGYHELQTLFIFLNHGDWLEFDVILGSDKLTLSPAIPGVPDEQNLIIRAARLLQAKLPSPQGAHIRLEKVLPMGGGIGGGSSDAATTLVALNHLWQAGLSEDELAELGVQLGADVPVFVRGKAAFAEGSVNGCSRSSCRVPGIWCSSPIAMWRPPPCSRILTCPEIPRKWHCTICWKGVENDCELLVKSATPRLPMRSAGC